MSSLPLYARPSLTSGAIAIPRADALSRFGRFATGLALAAIGVANLEELNAACINASALRNLEAAAKRPGDCVRSAVKQDSKSARRNTASQVAFYLLAVWKLVMKWCGSHLTQVPGHLDIIQEQVILDAHNFF